jgi:hypothetical protein
MAEEQNHIRSFKRMAFFIVRWFMFSITRKYDLAGTKPVSRVPNGITIRSDPIRRGENKCPRALLITGSPSTGDSASRSCWVTVMPEASPSSQQPMVRRGSVAAKKNTHITAKERYAAKMRRGHFLSKNKPIRVLYHGSKIYAI